MSACLIYINVPDPDAGRGIARMLVEQRLAAGVNIIDGMRSVYRWEGAVEENRETMLIVKTTEATVPALTEKVRSLHLHEVPCIVALSLAGGNADYFDWIESNTTASR